jgi:hypothetical protein
VAWPQPSRHDGLGRVARSFGIDIVVPWLPTWTRSTTGCLTE